MRATTEDECATPGWDSPASHASSKSFHTARDGFASSMCKENSFHSMTNCLSPFQLCESPARRHVLTPAGYQGGSSPENHHQPSEKCSLSYDPSEGGPLAAQGNSADRAEAPDLCTPQAHNSPVLLAKGDADAHFPTREQPQPTLAQTLGPPPLIAPPLPPPPLLSPLLGQPPLQPPPLAPPPLAPNAAPPPPPISKSVGPPGVRGVALPDATKSTQPTRPSLRAVYWKRLLSDAASSSVWSSDAIRSIPAAFEPAELEAAFSSRPSTLAAGASRSLVGAKDNNVSLLDHKRATNAGIALARLGIPLGGALRRALLSMDEGALPLHKCSVLLGVAPTAEETEVLRAYDGDVALLGSTERYFLELIAVPRFIPRLQAWCCKQRCVAHASELEARAAALTGALREVVADESLHAALGLLLALGNCLNEGSLRGQAAGFKLDSSILQICTMRCNGHGGSLLTFLARHAERTAPGRLCGLSALASRLSGASKSAEPTELESEVAQLRKEIGEARVAVELQTAADEAAEAQLLEDERIAAEERIAADEMMEKDRTASYNEEKDAVAGSTPCLNMAGYAEAAETEYEVSIGTESEREEVKVEEKVKDAFVSAMAPFLSEADGLLVSLDTAMRELHAEAEACCTFFCEPAPSLEAAYSLLQRLQEFALSFGSAVEAEKKIQATASNSIRSGVGVGMPGISPRRQVNGRAGANPPPAFEACDSSLKRILEGEEDHEPPMLGAHKLPSPSGTKLRRVGQAAFGAPGLNAQAAELQALFERRASGMGIGTPKRL